jgi:hypothetical protein
MLAFWNVILLAGRHASPLSCKPDSMTACQLSDMKDSLHEIMLAGWHSIVLSMPDDYRGCK